MDIILALVDLVPNPRFSSSLMSDAWLYLAGGLVAFSSLLISLTARVSPSFIDGNISTSGFLNGVRIHPTHFCHSLSRKIEILISYFQVGFHRL